MMPRADISYDFADFGLTQQQLEAKYGANGHPEYVQVTWRQMQDQGEDAAYNGYWDWVMQQIAKDDDAIPDSEGQGAPVAAAEQPKPELVAVTSLNQFAAMVSHWHRNKVARVENLRDIPAGTEATLTVNDVPTTIKLEGDALMAFQLAMTTVLAEIGELPFVFSVDEPDAPAEPAEQAAPAAGTANDQPASGV